MIQNRSQKEAQEENGKSVKTNNTTRFQLGFCCPRESKIDGKIDKKWIANASKLECTFEGDFLTILVDFGGHLGIQDGAKIEEKRHQKQERF